MQPVVVLGSLSDHGGVVVTASADVLSNGIPVARLGDLHACPIPHHGVTPVFDFSAELVDGLPVLRAFTAIAGCGATIVTGDPTVLAG